MQQTPSSVPKVDKVCIIGPECTGKTVLSESLARHYKTAWVEEYARAYLNKLGRPYDEDDLVKIAHAQLRMEDEWQRDANQLLFCDTNLIVIKVWSEFKYGQCHKDILRLIEERKYALYLLTYIDVPWVSDPLREHPDQRDKLYNIYLNEMKNQQTPFVEIKGTESERLNTAIASIEKHLGVK